MKKFLIALLFVVSTLAFGQDGRTKVNFFNQTSTTLRFMLNGNPVCTGDVIPQGYCTEPVNPGTYTASATNGQQTTGGQTFDIAYGETYNYRVFVENSAAPVPEGLKLANYRTVSQSSNQAFDVTFAGNGEVKTESGANDAGTSRSYAWESSTSDVYQYVTVRIVNHDIAVDFTSSNFYANEDLKDGTNTELNRSTGYWQGHPFTYSAVSFVGGNGATLTTRTRYIIVSAREVIFISQTSLASFDDNAIWQTFETSLNIK